MDMEAETGSNGSGAAAQTVAIVGASANRHKFGNKSVRAHAKAGYRVYPINLGGDPIEGLQSSRRLADIDGTLDRISVYLPPSTTLAVLPEIARAEAREVWFNPGSSDPRVRAAAESLGIPAIYGCSIVDVGYSPADFS